MKKITAFAFILSFCSLHSIAQQGINKGKIFTTTSVLDGYVAVSIYDQTPQEFKFSINPDGPFKIIEQREIIKVEYADGLTFEKHHVNIPVINKVLLERAQDDYKNPANKFESDAFVEIKLSGATSLYQLIDKTAFAHFFYKSSEDSDIVYLPNQTYVENAEIKYDQSYKNLIGYLLQKSGCTINKGEIDLLRYEASDLARIFRKINQCQGAAAVGFEKQNGVQWSGGVVGGIATSYVRPATYFNDKWGRSIDPKIGFYVSVSPKHNLKGYAVGLELTTDSYSGESDSVQNSSTRGKEYYSRMAIHLAPFVKFYLSQDKRPGFAELGLVISDVLSTKLKYEFISNGTTNKTEYSAANGFYYLFFMAVGVEFNKLSLQARFCSSISKENKNNYFGLIGKFKLF